MENTMIPDRLKFRMCEIEVLKALKDYMINVPEIKSNSSHVFYVEESMNNIINKMMFHIINEATK